MGIKNLNKIFKNEDIVNNTTYKYTIIDGSNLMYMTLAGVFSSLKKLYGSHQWVQTVNMDLFHQINHIITESTKLLIMKLKYYLMNCDKLYFVMDPSKPIYTLTNDIKYNDKYKAFIPDYENFDNNTSIQISLKEAEQEKRKASVNKTADLSYKQEEFKKYTQLGFQQVHIDILYDIYKQVYYFNDTGKLLKLGYIVLDNVTEYFRTTNKEVVIVQACDEADLVIKNIGWNLSQNNKVLVLSADTDYCVLFVDCPNVDVGPLNKSERGVVNPYNVWNRILGDLFSPDLVYRIAPLLGNDYTVKASVTTPENFQDFINLMTDYKKVLMGNTIKTIYKIAQIRDEIYPDGILNELQLDDLIYEYSKIYKPEYFKPYYLSTIMYSNWGKFSQYTIHEVNKNRLGELLYNIICDVNDSKQLYLPDFNKVLVDWNGLFQTLQCVPFNTPEECLLYYNSISNEPVTTTEYGEETNGWI